MWPFDRKQPVKQEQRRVQTPKLTAIRNYAAGMVDRLTASWTNTPMTADEVTHSRLSTLRARSREQYANNDYAKRYVNMVRNHVVGANGILLQAKIKDPSGTMDKAANQAVELAWGNWGRKESADVEQRLTWGEQQRLFVATAATDGEAIVQIIVSRNLGRFSFALKHIDPELLDVNHNAELENGNVIRFGIEFNSMGRRVAYHFRDMKAGSFYARTARAYIRVPAEDVIHGFIAERVGQKRGIPWCSTALMRMNMLQGYEEASLVAARAGASKMGFYKSSTGEQYQGDDTDENGNLIEQVEPGSMVQLPNGVEFQPYDPTYPAGEFTGFVKQSLRGISAGLGVSYNSLANDLESVNFSSMRHGAVEERDNWQVLQQWMIDEFCRPVYERWLTVQLLAGTITIAGKPLKVEREEKYRQVIWQARRWKWIDPLKDVKANIEAVNAGLRSRGSIIREGGDDPEDVWDEMEQENALLEKKGIHLQDSKTDQGAMNDAGGNDTQN